MKTFLQLFSSVIRVGPTKPGMVMAVDKAGFGAPIGRNLPEGLAVSRLLIVAMRIVALITASVVSVGTMQIPSVAAKICIFDRISSAKIGFKPVAIETHLSPDQPRTAAEIR